MQQPRSFPHSFSECVSNARPRAGLDGPRPLSDDVPVEHALVLRLSEVEPFGRRLVLAGGLAPRRGLHVLRYVSRHPNEDSLIVIIEDQRLVPGHAPESTRTGSTRGSSTVPSARGPLPSSKPGFVTSSSHGDRPGAYNVACSPMSAP